VSYSDPFGLCPIERPLCQWIKVALIAAGTDIGAVAGGGGGLLGGPAALVTAPAGAYAGAAAGATIGAALGQLVDNVFFSEKSDHAKERAQEGRPVREGEADVQRANQSDVFVQEDGRFVVRGARGREHIFEANGEHITSVVRTNAAHLQRLKAGSIRPATTQEFQALKDIFK
jgi:hypothetical protein